MKKTTQLPERMTDEIPIEFERSRELFPASIICSIAGDVSDLFGANRMLQANAAQSPRRVLIVEDDRAIYNACLVLLKHYEFEVVVAPTLTQARQCLASKPHLVLLDLSLPDGDGVQLLPHIRRACPGTRVFVLTGDLKAETEKRVKRYSPDRYFHKPLNFIEVLEAMRECLEESTTTARPAKAKW